MLGIICAMQIEADGLLALMRKVKKTTLLGYDFFVGELKKHKVAVVLCGIGKANAAAVTALLISAFGAKQVINLGVCGGTLSAGTMIVAKDVVQYDFDTTAFGNELGRIEGFQSPYIPSSNKMNAKLHGDVTGTIASGDKFLEDKAQIAFLNRTFGAIGFDMESGAVAQICTQAGVDFAVVRIVSDGGDKAQYERLKVEAAQRGVKAILEYLE